MSRRLLRDFCAWGVARNTSAIEAIVMLTRRSNGFAHVVRLASLLGVCGGAAMLLTACQAAGPTKGPEPVPEQPMAIAQAKSSPLGATDYAGPMPPKVLISGVPFVSFAQAARIRLPHGALMYSNPSETACLAMVLENWGYSQRMLERAETPELAKWERIGGEAQSWDDVKAVLLKGIPVQVVVALTPYGDRFPDTEPIAETVRKVGAAEGPRSGVLGRIIRFEDLPKIDQEWGINAERDPMHVAIFGSTRLVIGYDDVRKVVVLHDPTFGPAFEMSYDDFMPTWEVLGRRYVGSFPPDYAKRLAKRGANKPYRQRTPQEQAAAYYVYGYALNATGRPKEGEEQFRKGLAIPGIGPGYEHLLQLELAIALAAGGDKPGAEAAAQAAAKMLPEDPMPWLLLAELYARNPAPGAAAKAEQARNNAEKLANDERAVTRLSKVLPMDFWVMTLGHWAGRAEVDTINAPSASQSLPVVDSEFREAAEKRESPQVYRRAPGFSQATVGDSFGSR